MEKASFSKTIKKFKILYLIYMVLSILLAISSFIWILLLYLLGWKDTVTLFDLFMVAILVMTTFYMRINAFHYQNLHAQVHKPTLRKNEMKQERKRA